MVWYHSNRKHIRTPIMEEKPGTCFWGIVSVHMRKGVLSKGITQNRKPTLSAGRDRVRNSSSKVV